MPQKNPNLVNLSQAQNMKQKALETKFNEEFKAAIEQGKADSKQEQAII